MRKEDMRKQREAGRGDKNRGAVKRGWEGCISAVL